MLKVIDAISRRNPLGIVSDLNGTIHTGIYGNICADIIYHLDRRLIYNGKYKDLWEKAKNHWATPMEWEDRVRGVPGLLRDFAVTNIDWVDSGLYTIRNTKIEKPTKELLEVINTVPSVEFHIFTGSEKNIVKEFLNSRISKHVPNAKIEIYGTNLKYDGGRYFTGDVEEPLWNSENRAKKARELTLNKISVGIGNSLSNDWNMLEQETQSYFLTGPVTAYLNGYTKGNISCIKRENLSGELKKFLKSDLKEIMPRIAGINPPPIIARRF
ncbi:MAG: hypothetical protein GTN36_04105 [Candidatus Aenigmarchaeota archaeon]|nr:hypothetical protein [Candidatus Aenigmarchaeota archaeon]